MREFARIIAAISLLMLFACSSVKYVPVETILRDTTYISQTKVDSVYNLDSIFVKEAGDTVYVNKYKYLYKYKELHDTLWREKVDTVTKVQFIEAQLTKWQKMKINMGEYLIAALVIAAIYLGFKLFRR